MGNNSIKTKCPECAGNTNHSLLFEISQPEIDYPETTLVFQIVQCKGCDTISLLYSELEEGLIECEFNFPSDHLYNFASQEIFLKYPERKKIPKIIQDVYKEMESALKTDLYLLAGIGLRTIVEAICIDQKVTGRNLQTKISILKELGHVSDKALPFIDRLREIGNISAHQIQTIDTDSLKHAVEIINHLLKSVYILPQINKKIKTPSIKKSSETNT
jgi:hypothetical protein